MHTHRFGARPHLNPYLMSYVHPCHYSTCQHPEIEIIVLCACCCSVVENIMDTNKIREKRDLLREFERVSEELGKEENQEKMAGTFVNSFFFSTFMRLAGWGGGRIRKV
jgi:hypothetical protein